MNITKRNGTIDILLIFVLFIVSIGIHYYYVTYLIQEVTDKMQLFSTAIVETDSVLEYVPHGATYLYTIVLNFLFYMIGNKILVPVILQIVMKMVGFLFLFFTLRMSGGKISAFVTTTILLFLPMNYELLNQITPVVMSVLFLCVQAFFLSLLAKGIGNQMFGNYGWGILFVFYGISCSITLYADISGIFLLLLSFIVFVVLQPSIECQGLQHKVLQILCVLLGAIIGTLGIGCFISSTFKISFEAPYVSYVYDYIMNITPEDYFYVFLIVASILFGILLQTIYNHLLTSQKEEDYEVPDVLKEPVVTPRSLPLNNPLPVPKKHERKEMDYAVGLNPDTMNFDKIDTSETDDFDID